MTRNSVLQVRLEPDVLALARAAAQARGTDLVSLVRAAVEKLAEEGEDSGGGVGAGAGSDVGSDGAGRRPGTQRTVDSSGVGPASAVPVGLVEDVDPAGKHFHRGIASGAPFLFRFEWWQHRECSVCGEALTAVKV